MNFFKLAFRQLRPMNAMRFLLSETMRRIFDRHRSGSYAQHGEDAIILSLLDHKRDGFYVDVGCHAPRRLSNTYRLYLRGWRGLVIDGNPAFADQFRRERPLDTFVHAYVGDCERNETFSVYADPALSSLSDKRMESPHFTLVRSESVQTMRLDAILSAHQAPRHFDLLSIDVEHRDFEALKGIDLTIFRPTLIVIEAHDADVTRIGEHRISRHLYEFGYRPVAAAGNNLFFRLT